ncbi:hypothetical protein PU629_21020 [Pullulanibacillus sp. KACC 23026]|uniref:hypothetical protein n=1 Tax=Pullulanibacillus sp. KACC 23026 TaxID=3028315 RepID=UPI0023B1583A|nr:hypothetical protein [Pullulanibacillus sp. KACC 23026]WEG12539.1 hypothetical protein PU629_21020 [Pullulanibacillus sp. KACC 23026]
MKLIKRGDLVLDKYGNYYYATDISPTYVRLTNAFMDLCFRRTLDDLYFEEYKGQLIGERLLSLLKGNIEMILNKKSRFSIIPLEEVESHFDVFIDQPTDITN